MIRSLCHKCRECEATPTAAPRPMSTCRVCLHSMSRCDIIQCHIATLNVNRPHNVLIRWAKLATEISDYSRWQVTECGPFSDVTMLIDQTHNTTQQYIKKTAVKTDILIVTGVHWCRTWTHRHCVYRTLSRDRYTTTNDWLLANHK